MIIPGQVSRGSGRRLGELVCGVVRARCVRALAILPDGPSSVEANDLMGHELQVVALGGDQQKQGSVGED